MMFGKWYILVVFPFLFLSGVIILVLDNKKSIKRLQKNIDKTYYYNDEKKHTETKSETLNDNDNCCLIPKSKNGPTPVILMTLGRSGSGSTWQILGNLTGQETKSRELTGSSPNKSKQFFQSIQQNDGGDWLLKYLCSEQKKYKKAGIVGFKWKPYKTIFTNQSMAALEVLSKLKFSDHPIRIIRSRRNLLDVYISRMKHFVNPYVEAHCKPDDTECAKEHMQIGTGMILATKSLVHQLRTFAKLEDEVDELLIRMNLPHIQVTYEKLYHNNGDTSEWKRILDFLGMKEPNERELTWHNISHAMGHVFTSNRQHNVTLKNFDEVQEMLKGTEFEKLLH